MKLTKINIDSIVPYENNPRNNDGAVADVMQSIRECGYVAPIIIDENNVVLAGHTRLKAAKRLGWTEVEVIVREGLSEEQKRKYRILDNKTNELAEWDFSKLEEELAGLDFSDFSFSFDIEKPEHSEVTSHSGEDSYSEGNSYNGGEPNSEGNSYNGGISGSEQNLREGREIDIDDYSAEKFECTCPKCGFRFNRNV